MQNKNVKNIIVANLRSQAPVGYRRFQIGFVFAEYDLFKPTTFIQNCVYMNLTYNYDTVYIHFPRQEHQILSFNS